jgi:osmotically inducible protein OsmC
MKLAFVLNAAGFTATSIDTTAVVVLDAGAITTIELTTQVACPGISGETFQNLAADAKENCPVSKLMKAAVVLNATLL